MRIIKLLLSSLVILGIVGAISFLVVRETLLFLSVQQIKTDLKAAVNVAYQTAEYKNLCREKGLIDSSTELIKEVRLRFTSDNEYQTEVVCTQFSLEAIPVKENTLPYWVKKIPGQSGIVWLADQSGVSLKLWGRQRHVYVEKDQFVDHVLAGTLTNPKSSCSGYGYSCCLSEESLGQGLQITQVTDCTQSCFQSCIARPVVLSINTDPIFDPQSRSLRVVSGTTVAFEVVADTRDPLEDQELASYQISYGDGQQETKTKSQLPFEHTYYCSTGNCFYPVQVKVVNANQIDSALTTVSQLRVIVN